MSFVNILPLMCLEAVCHKVDMSLLRMNARAHVTLTHLTQLMQVSKDIVGWWDIVPNVCQESVLLPPVQMPLGQ